MKNVIFGIMGGFVVLITILTGMIICGNTSRSNEMEHGLARVVYKTLEQNYGKEVPEQSIKRQIQKGLSEWVNSDSDCDIHIVVCDLKAGILSVEVREQYTNPLGKKKEQIYQKTAIVEDTQTKHQ